MIKRIRIATSVIELNNGTIYVYRKGEKIKAITSTYFTPEEIFARECEFELKRHLNRVLAD